MRWRRQAAAAAHARHDPRARRRWSDPSDGPWDYEQSAARLQLPHDRPAGRARQLADEAAGGDARARGWRARTATTGCWRGLPLKLPARRQDRVSAWHLYAIELGDGATCSRAELFAALREAGIGVNVHYIPIHLQPYYRELGFAPGDFPAAEHYYARAVSLPLFPAMTDAQQDRVVEVVRAAVAPESSAA